MLPRTPEELDKQLRMAARLFDTSWGWLEPLRAEAKARQIHKDLRFKSWPHYTADVTHREMPNVSRSPEQRRHVVALLAGEGMSQRAIADAVGCLTPPSVGRSPTPAPGGPPGDRIS